MFVAGGWIYYNTNILNHYQTPSAIMDDQADYERRYAIYKDLPEPSPVDVAMEVDLYPQERRLISRGVMTLQNMHDVALDKLVISVDPRLAIESLEVEGGTPSLQDKAHGLLSVQSEPSAAAGLRTCA